MATAARFAPASTATTSVVSGGRSSGGGATSCPVAVTTASSTTTIVTTDGGDTSTNSSPLHQSTQLIVLPANLHQGTTTVVNGVPVIDVSALEQAADSSNESTGTNHHADSQQENHLATPSPHFITVTVASDADSVASHQGYHVQYVEPEIYTAAQANGTQAQMAYPVYTVGESGTIYASSQGYYAAAAAASAAVGSTAGGVAGGGTTTVGYTTASGAHYLVQQAVDAEALIASRNSPQTTNAVQWLLENYETAEGVSLPRYTLYAHYLRHCSEHKLEPVNAASFGKLIRSVFLGLRTRRLGTRGNSKYHYYGIRVKPTSSLNTLESESCSSSRNNSSSSHSGGCSGGNGAGGKVSSSSGRGYKRNHDNMESSMSASIISQHLNYLGDGTNAIPMFPEIHFSCALPDDCGYEDVDTLRSIYREHLEAFLDAVMSLEFSTVESLWREFWRSQDNNNGDECEEEKYLSKSKLFALCAMEPVQIFMRQVDLAFYQNLIQVLVPDVLKPIPATLTQSIRNFAKSLEGWLTGAMSGSAGAPVGMLAAKVAAASAFGSSLRRYTSLNHLAQAARAVLHNGAQIAQMLSDLGRVDFHSVREQAAWVCQCDNDIVARFEADFKLTLQQQNSLEQWASWLKNVVKSALKPYEGKPSFSKAARQFLLKWSFYSSMVIRDLTLRSAASFGSFHLIRLLYDEYMFYLIEHQVAEATGIVPIAVMVEGIKQDIMQNNLSIYGNEMSLCNGSMNPNNTVKLGCNSPSDHNKHMKIS